MKRLALVLISAALIATSALAEPPKPSKEDIAYAEKRIQEIDATLPLILKELQATPQMTLYNYLTAEKQRLQKVLPVKEEKKEKK